MLPNAEMCRYGTIIQYAPMIYKGIIRDRDTGKLMNFRLKNVFSPLLHRLLENTGYFDQQHADVIIEPDIEVSYLLCREKNSATAGRICLEQEIDPGANLARPSYGVITWIGKNGMGWIQPDEDDRKSKRDEDQKARGFGMTNVIDPVLESLLKSGMENPEMQTTERWRKANVRVRFWKFIDKEGKPKAFHIAWDDKDESSRQARARREKLAPALPAQTQAQWIRQRNEYMFPPALAQEIPYEDAPQMIVLSPEKQKIFEKFRSQVNYVTESEPAILNRADEFWQYIDDPDKLISELNREPYIANTRFAKLCIAAGAFRSGEYAMSIRHCVSTERYNIAAEIAKLQGLHGIEQRLLEMSMDLKIDDDLIHRLTDTIQHTGNADAFCYFFSEWLNVPKSYPKRDMYVDEFCNAAASLLEDRKINTQEMDEGELLSALEEHVMCDLPELEELLEQLSAQERKQRADAIAAYEAIRRREIQLLEEYAVKAASEQTPADGGCSRTYNAAELQEEFRTIFRDEESKMCRVPDPEKDRCWLPLLDRLLEAEKDPANCRIPMLVRLCLDFGGSEKQLLRYMNQLEEYCAAKRKKTGQERRFRMAQALLEGVQAVDAEARAAAMKKAAGENPTAEEKQLLEFISGREEN